MFLEIFTRPPLISGRGSPSPTARLNSSLLYITVSDDITVLVAYSALIKLIGQ